MRCSRLIVVVSCTVFATLGPAAASTAAPRAAASPEPVAAQRLAPLPVPVAAEQASPSRAAAWQRFREQTQNGGAFRAYFDLRTDRPSLVEMSLPWLAPASLTGQDEARVMERLETLARDFLRQNRDLFAVDPAQLVLDRQASRPTLPVETPAGSFYRLWQLSFRWAPHGEPVAGARVGFVVNAGNLVQVVMENVGDAAAVLPASAGSVLTAADALRVVEEEIGGFSVQDRLVGEPRLAVMPLADGEEGRGYAGAPGRGLRYRAAWQLRFTHAGAPGSWNAVVDAESGELLALRDAAARSYVLGKVRQPGDLSHEYQAGLPLADYTENPTNYASSQGFFPLSIVPTTSHLAGQKVVIDDACGSITVTGSAGSDLDFGGAASPSSTDCNSAAGSNDGNTSAARTAYYWVNQGLLAAESRMGSLGISPSSPITAQVNEFGSACLAYYEDSTSTLVFKRDTTARPVGCRNTAENASHVLHETGHAIDYHDGAQPADSGSAEAYGDIVAALLTQDSCIARGAAYSANGDGCGEDSGVPAADNACTDCDGFRDVDWRQHADPEPRTPALSLQLCATSSYPGPCGLQPHCESLVASEAVWDLVLELEDDGLSAGEAFGVVNDIFFSSRPSGGPMFTCANATTSGEGGAVGGSLYYTLRAADDCDGDPSNGTPHGAAIFAALDRHDIAVGGAGDAANQDDTSLPDADFTWSCTDGACTFNGTSSHPSAASAYYWTFGDGGTATTAIPSHTFLASGTYPVTLRVTDACGRQDSLTQQVTVTTPAVVMAEMGAISVRSTQLTTVSLSHTFTNPVVLVKPASRYSWTVASNIRIVSLQGNSFSVRLDSQYGSSPVENAYYLVVEEGVWELQGSGALLQAGTLASDGVVGLRVGASWDSVTFPTTFPATPVILAQVQSYNDTRWLETRQRNNAAGGFDVAMEEFEYSTHVHAPETVGWVALSAGTGQWSNHNYLAKSSDQVSDAWSSIYYASGWCNNSWWYPHMIADLGTRNEGHGHLRYRNINYSTCRVDLMVEEDTTYDSETYHVNEQVNMLTLSGGGLLRAVAVLP